ncbi:MAG TPA: lysophospholipid acyltransferase family protein [Thermoanaerobaculia bacterium]|nr:lysophospholipid acyltransferase family protein [Thermoanaerobaculia bacterium]
MRRPITAFFRFCLRVFFKRIELLGLDRVPLRDAIIFAVNHPNGLVDPLFLLCFAPKPVSFLAKAPLFRWPIIGWIIRAFDAIPVYRKEEMKGGSLAEANAELFRRSREVLQRGGAIALFPEGTTHDDPQLRELKTGAARIALGANVDAMTVVPTGIYYTAKHVFRSSVLVLFGEPIHVQPLVMDGEPPADEVDRLTATIDAGLDSVTLQAESHAALDLIARAENIFTADDDQPLIQEFDLRRRFLQGYHYLSARDPERLSKLQHTIAQFEAELRRAKLDVHELQPKIDARRLFRVLVLLPLALIGAIVHWPAYRVIDALAKRFSKGEWSTMATAKFLAALTCYPLTYIAIALMIGWRFSITAGVIVTFITPILGYIALRVIEEADEVIGDLRALLHRIFRNYGYSQLVTRRAAIRDEMLNVAREMER